MVEITVILIVSRRGGKAPIFTNKGSALNIQHLNMHTYFKNTVPISTTFHQGASAVLELEFGREQLEYNKSYLLGQSIASKTDDMTSLLHRPYFEVYNYV